LDERKRRQQREARKTISDFRRQQQRTHSITKGPSYDASAALYEGNGDHDDDDDDDQNEALRPHSSYESVKSGTNGSVQRFERLKVPTMSIGSRIAKIESNESNGRYGDDEAETDQEIMDSPTTIAQSVNGVNGTNGVHSNGLKENLLRNNNHQSYHSHHRLADTPSANGYHNGNGMVQNQGYSTNEDNGVNGNGGYYYMKGYQWLKAVKYQYLWLCLYCLISYVGCDVWLIASVDGGFFEMGLLTQILVALGIVLGIGCVVLYHPFMLRRILNKAQLELIGDVLSDIEDDGRLSVSVVPMITDKE